MRDSLFKMFGSVKLVQEVSRSSSAQSQSTANLPSSSGPSAVEVSPSSSPDASSSTQRNSEPLLPSPSPTTSSYSSYWPTHSVQPIPFSFNNYTPATPSLPMWISSYTYNKPTRGVRDLLFGGASTQSTLPPASTTNPRNHSRRSSRSIRRSRQLSKSTQKLLCLWPLPVITRYIIALSLLISCLNFFDVLHVSCSSPSLVLYRLDFANLALSPFLFTWSLHGILIFGWNVLVLGLFEESLTHMLGGTRQFIRLLAGIVLGVSVIRQGLGYLFTKSTGWAVPILFFNDSVHECSQGIAPFLFALLMVQSLSLEDKYIMLYGDTDPNHKLTVRKVTLQLFMCLVNYLVKNILWWSLTGLITGYIAAFIIQATILRGKRHSTWSKEESSFDDFTRPTPLWRLLWSALKKAGAVAMLAFSILLLFNAYYLSQEGSVDLALLNQLSDDRYMFTFVVMTAPRRGDPAFLSRTLDSYLSNWPTNPEPESLYSRIQVIVYTHFSNHSGFDAARERYSTDPKAQRYIKWLREEGADVNQRLHVSKALRQAVGTFQSTYVALMEDDFPMCGSNAWRDIENTIYKAHQQVPDHCGVFVGTGGR
ncbi:hypothetical protein BX666DRAFT_1860890 [Dichotomocladium elegans]|nr:hypothetical protein BX666DRAFT_1860890 [Dichotomocladium elegans]